ncbi:hypothetical protein [Natrialba aegyptia]|uniref:Uncharacterized protein n=1 Tax=Natrialba aegyptia DSM 13077 TaxID=1227491 RepID=M0B7L0_9EURY|nr:hypothetical protein [Natrialba aegyptia]ELZ06805.1 hypothetical protein C480_07237 [Natrialba aegyptia DSM 13077]
MSKTSRSALAETVQRDLIAYLRSGRTINQQAVTERLDSTGLSISDFDRLKRIHFTLSEPVRDYLDELPERLRRVRTASNVEREQVRGEVRGAVDWGQTYRARYAENPDDRSKFVTRSPYTEYQLPENVLLKTLLSILAETVKTDISAIDQSWRRDVWSDANAEAFVRRISQNIHLDRINADEDTPIEASHLEAARRSRQPLYYEAYELYQLYDRLLNNEFDEPRVREILFETLFVPDTATLFELACVFRLLRSLEDEYEVALHTIEAGSGAIAELRTDRWQIEVYHDETGPLTFNERLPEDPMDEYLRRYERVLDRHRNFLGRKSHRPLYQGRPDLIMVVNERKDADKTPRKILLGEFKHSSSESVFSDAVQEIFEYLEYARPEEAASRRWDTDEYLVDEDSIDFEGVIVTDGHQPEGPRDDLVHLAYQSIAESVEPGDILDL